MRVFCKRAVFQSTRPPFESGPRAPKVFLMAADRTSAVAPVAPIDAPEDTEAGEPAGDVRVPAQGSGFRPGEENLRSCTIPIAVAPAQGGGSRPEEESLRSCISPIAAEPASAGICLEPPNASPRSVPACVYICPSAPP